MQKILYIITLPDWGGAQRYVFDLANNSKDSCEVVVASGKSEGASKINPVRERAVGEFSNGGIKSTAKMLPLQSPTKSTNFSNGVNLSEKCRECGIATHQFKNLMRPISPAKDILAVWEMKNYLEKEKPDTIHLNSSKAGIIASFAAALSQHKPKVIYTVHGWVFMEPMNAVKKWLYVLLEKLASRWRDKVIVLGEKEKQIAIKYKICPEKKLDIQRHSIPCLSFLDKEDAKTKLNLPQDKKIIGTIANFYPPKGIGYLIEAAAQINNPDIIFAIIGDGPLAADLRFKILDLRLENRFLLLGEKNNAAQCLKAFDVFILPSVKEGAPFAILEAMAAGLPIIATDVGNVSEMLKDYQNKIIIPSADVEALSKAIEDKIS